VPAGTTVRWEQLDGTTHSVTAGTREAPEPDVFDAELAEGETFEHTFDEPGTYDYFCSFHNGPGMTGRVVVE
jgi:plastocyanin